MGIIQTIFDALSAITEALGGLLGTVFQNVIDLIYTAPVAPETTGSLTVVGVLLLIGMAVGLFFFVLRWIRGLIRVNG